jgi:hypothetical protein
MTLKNEEANNEEFCINIFFRKFALWMTKSDADNGFLDFSDFILPIRNLYPVYVYNWNLLAILHKQTLIG